MTKEANQILTEIEAMFPDYFRARLEPVFTQIGDLEEIRLRTNQPILYISKGKEYQLDTLNERDMNTVWNHICGYSPYAFQDEIRQGFFTVQGGHRIGLAGQTVTDESGKITTIKYIRYLNVRVCHEKEGIAENLINELFEKKQLCNTLIVSPPGCGKTTLLRDIIRILSDGNTEHEGMTIGVVDERAEIAGCYQGIPQNNIGKRTDVMTGCRKAIGMMMLIRSMTPKVLAVDELGGPEDIDAFRQALYCGCKVIATVHGESIEDIINKPFLASLLSENIVKRIIILRRTANWEFVRKVHYVGSEHGKE